MKATNGGQFGPSFEVYEQDWENIFKEETEMSTDAYRWDAEAGCYLMDTAAGPRPYDPVIYHIPPTGDISVDVTKRSPSGPFDVTVIDEDTGLSLGTRTFADRRAALDYARLCYRAEGGKG